MMKRVSRVSNVHSAVYFKQKQRLTIAFGNTLSHRKQSHKRAKVFIVGRIAYHQHVTLLKLNSLTTSQEILINKNK